MSPEVDAFVPWLWCAFLLPHPWKMPKSAWNCSPNKPGKEICSYQASWRESTASVSGGMKGSKSNHGLCQLQLAKMMLLCSVWWLVGIASGTVWDCVGVSLHRAVMELWRREEEKNKKYSRCKFQEHRSSPGLPLMLGLHKESHCVVQYKGNPSSSLISALRRWSKRRVMVSILWKQHAWNIHFQFEEREVVSGEKRWTRSTWQPCLPSSALQQRLEKGWGEGSPGQKFYGQHLPPTRQCIDLGLGIGLPELASWFPHQKRSWRDLQVAVVNTVIKIFKT